MNIVTRTYQSVVDKLDALNDQRRLVAFKVSIGLKVIFAILCLAFVPRGIELITYVLVVCLADWFLISKLLHQPVEPDEDDEWSGV